MRSAAAPHAAATRGRGRSPARVAQTGGGPATVECAIPEGLSGAYEVQISSGCGTFGAVFVSSTRVRKGCAVFKSEQLGNGPEFGGFLSNIKGKS